MYRFLVVGCGGSGGATLAYLMDQLRSDLAAHGVQTLPRGWQFVHLDVPNVSEPGPDGLGSTQEQGGKYFGSGPRGNSYGVLDHAVSQRFAQRDALDSIATWAPRAPEAVITPISHGAGQLRAVGRMITLSRASEIRETLQNVWVELNRVETTTEMSRLSVPGLGPYNDNTPIVLVVSSMAGGAGASMALDVCRLLTLIPDLNPTLMGVFMVAANIFDSFPEAERTGVRANALAMLGEIVASQTGAAQRHDVATLKALGHDQGAGVRIPFARVFPVGRFAGVERTLFGDGTPKAVYRGLGRGLAGLIMSGKATDQFVSFDLGNTASPEGDRDLLGWGSDWDPLPWGSYGFASLSMGRDRYAEYSAQRISHSCVDRLLHGHLQPNSQASSNEQVAALVDSQWPRLCDEMALPACRVAPTEIDKEVGGWMMQRAFPRPAAETAAGAVAEREVDPYIPNPGGMAATQWVPTLRYQLGNRRDRIKDEANKAAVTWAFRWQQGLLERTETVVGDAAARLGLPYAIAVVERLSLHVREVLAPSAERLSGFKPADLGAIPSDIEPVLGGLHGVVNNGQQLIERLRAGYRNQVGMQLYSHAADLIRQLLNSYAVDVLIPLREALAEAQRVLENAMDAAVTDLGLARLATDQCAAWPSDADVRVQTRFDEADNEVLLTSSAHFQDQYTADILRAVQVGSPHFADARSEAIREVISGTWPTTGGDPAPGGLVEPLATWRSRVFATDPITNQALIPAHAQFKIHVRPAELLGRARLFVARPGESFRIFCELSLRDFVEGKGASESQLERRKDEVVEKFVQALTLARPLISVNGVALQALHKREIEYRYKFSEIPFAALPVEQRLRQVVDNNPRIDQASLTNLVASVGDSTGVTRIDIFGSYPNYSPLVFDAVLTPVAEQWGQTGEEGRASFWRWRRSRPLDASLPMGEAERRAMVAGWFLGQLVGHIRIPGAPFRQPVEIWDDDNSRWLSFPDPLLTPPAGFIADYDWLPAVLESVLLAIARSHEAPVMSSLRPYQVLRRLFDATSQGPRSGINILSATELMTTWLREGPTATGGISRVAGTGAGVSVEDRTELAVAWLTGIRDLAGRHYMAPGDQGAPGKGEFSVVSRRRQASSTPMFRDLAPDVYWATGELILLVEEAKTAALQEVTTADGHKIDTSPKPDVGFPILKGGPF